MPKLMPGAYKSIVISTDRKLMPIVENMRKPKTKRKERKSGRLLLVKNNEKRKPCVLRKLANEYSTVFAISTGKTKLYKHSRRI